jgi:hypothetical protein
MAIDTMVKRLLDERDQKLSLIDQIAGVADDEGRDLLESENQTITSAQDRVRSLNAQVDRLSQDLELADSARNRIKALDPSVIAKDFSYRSAGDFLYDMLHKGDNPDCGLRINRFMKRAAEHMGFDKANTVPVAGGFNGLVVNPVIGPVLDPSPTGRPLFTVIGARQLTALTFNRPRLVDPNFSTGVGVVTQEKAEMPSRAWDIVSEVVTTTRVGGYINVSEVLVEMLSGSLDMVVSHMNRRIEGYSEIAVVTELDKTTEVIPLAADATSADITTAIGLAASAVVTNTRNLPTWVAMGPAAWGALIGISDLAGRPMMPPIGPVNAFGTGGADAYFSSFGGLRAAVSPAITDKSIYVGNSFGLEIYEKAMPLMQAFEPSLYGRQVAVATFLGFYAPITAEAGAGNTPPAERNGTVKIDWA